MSAITILFAGFSLDAKEHNQSISDIGSINIDIESVDGSPIMTKVGHFSLHLYQLHGTV